MATADTYDMHTPLGVGGIISESFSIFFRKIGLILILGFIPTVAGIVVSGALTGWGYTLGFDDPSFIDPTSFYVSLALSVVVGMAFYGLTIALLVLLAYDAKQGQSRPITGYFAPALRSVIPIAVLAVVIAILATIGFMALIIPGLWIYAVFAVVYPAVAIEGVGFRGLGRSASLTKGYRWPVAGVIIVIGICTVILNAVAAFISEFLIGSVGGGIVLSTVVTGALYALTYGLSGISIALIYARLREIKEGVSVSDLAAVFD